MANSLTNMVGEYLFEQRIRTDSASIESLAVRIAPLLAKGDTQELYTQLSTAGGELAGGTYEKTRVYFGKDLKKTLDELWAEEEAGIEHVFDAEITEINGSVVTVRPAAGTAEAASSDKIQFVTGNLERIGFNVGTVVQVTYKGGIRETYPAQINAISWKNADDLRDRDFDGE